MDIFLYPFRLCFFDNFACVNANCINFFIFIWILIFHIFNSSSQDLKDKNVLIETHSNYMAI